MENYSIEREEEFPLLESKPVRRMIRAKYSTQKAGSILLVYAGICELCGDNSRGSWPIKQIASRSSVAYPTASASLDELSSMGIIRIEKQRDEKGHLKPSKITLLSRFSLNQNSQDRESLFGEFWEQKNSSKEPIKINPNTAVPEQPEKPQGAAIKIDLKPFKDAIWFACQRAVKGPVVWPVMKWVMDKIKEYAEKVPLAEWQKWCANYERDPFIKNHNVQGFMYNPEKYRTLRKPLDQGPDQHSQVVL